MPGEFEPPKLNLEIFKVLQQSQRTNDDNYLKVQRDASFALASLGSAINMLKYKLTIFL